MPPQTNLPQPVGRCLGAAVTNLPQSVGRCLGAAENNPTATRRAVPRCRRNNKIAALQLLIHRKRSPFSPAGSVRNGSCVINAIHYRSAASLHRGPRRRASRVWGWSKQGKAYKLAKEIAQKTDFVLYITLAYKLTKHNTKSLPL